MRTWNEDPFTKKARRENYEARSIYKLEEIDRRDGVLKGARQVLDLGAAPGSWTQYCLKTLPHAKVVAVDLSAMELRHPNLTCIQASVEDAALGEFLQGPVDVVLSDMAPKTSGQAERDVALSVDLASSALTVAQKFLKPGGNFVVKLFMGAGFEEYRAALRTSFAQVSLLRPQSTRKQSREIFFIAKGFRKD